MEFITGLLWNPEFPFLTFFVPAFALAWWGLGGLWEREERKTFVLWLKHDRSRHLYRHLITRALDAVSDFLGRWEMRLRRGRGWHETEIMERNRLPWSWGLLDFALLLAVAYPIVSLIGQWAILGEGKFGSLTVLPQTDWDDRWLPLILLGCSLISCLWAVTSNFRWLRTLFIPAIFFYVWFGEELKEYALPVAPAVESSGVLPIFSFPIPPPVFVVAFATAFAFVFASALSAAGVFAVAFAVAFVAAATPAITIGPIAGAAVAFGFPVALAVVLAVAFAGDQARSMPERKMNRPSLGLLSWLSVLFIILLITAVRLQPTAQIPIKEISAILLFLGLLPLLNAVADFASSGLTRHFLARGVEGHLGWFGLVDLLAGVATFFALGFAMIGTVALVKAMGGPELINLFVLLGPPGIPNAILTDPHAYWWLYLTFLSTLLPTVLHGFIATFAFGLMWPERLRMWLATSLESGSYVAGRPACLALAVLIALSVALPLTMLYYVGWALAVYYPHAGEVLIGIFREFAVLTGAI